MGVAPDTSLLLPVNTSAGQFNGSVAVITGGAGGVGVAVGKELGLRGAQVCLVDIDRAQLEAAANGLAQGGVAGVRCHTCDVTSEASVTECFTAILRDMKFVTILVQAAGITGKTNMKTHEVEYADLQRVFRINLDGIFLCARAVLPSMLARNYGRIVNIASVSGKEGNAGMLAYSSSKAAVIGLTKVMGKEYAETGITVNCVAPAVINTKMVAAMPEATVNYMLEKIPMKRTCKLNEIANMVAFIASPEASFTTAFCFDTTGGRSTY